MFPRIIPSPKEWGEWIKDVGYSFAELVGSTAHYITRYSKQAIVVGVGCIIQPAKANQEHYFTLGHNFQIRRETYHLTEEMFYAKIIPIAIVGVTAIACGYYVTSLTYQKKRKLLQDKRKSREKIEEHEAHRREEQMYQKQLHLEQRIQQRLKAKEIMASGINSSATTIIVIEKLGRIPKKKVRTHDNKKFHVKTKYIPQENKIEKQVVAQKPLRTPAIPATPEKKTFLSSFPLVLHTQKSSVDKKPCLIKKPRPSPEKCMTLLEEYKTILQGIVLDSKDQKHNPCLSYTSLLYIIPRIYITLSIYLDKKHLNMTDIMLDTASVRLFFQHATMEIDIKTLTHAAIKLNESLNAILLQLNLPNILVKGKNPVSKTNLFITISKGFHEVETKGLIANSSSKDMKLLFEKDTQYFNWVKYKIVPFINLFSKKLLKEPAGTNISYIYPLEVCALKKLFAFIGEYYKSSRHQRFAKFSKGLFSSVDNLSSLLKEIHDKVRNRVEHLDPQYLEVISDDKLLELCQKIKIINAEEANLSDFNDNFTYSFANYKKVYKLNPQAQEFVPLSLNRNKVSS